MPPPFKFSKFECALTAFPIGKQLQLIAYACVYMSKHMYGLDTPNSTCFDWTNQIQTKITNKIIF